jgi:hypothetical protein
MVSREEWIGIHPLGYAISSYGNVTGKRKNRLKPMINIHGYARVCLRDREYKKYKTIHSLVAEAFIGPRSTGVTINHKDGNKLNNHVDNLEYISRLENLKHAWANGRKCRGDSHGRRKLTSVEVDEIRQLYKRGNRSILAKTYGVCKEHITRITTGQNWSLISKDAGGQKS